MKKYILLLITIIFICILIIIIKNNKTFAAISDPSESEQSTSIELYENDTIVASRRVYTYDSINVTYGIFNNLIENDSTILPNKQYPVSYKVLNSGDWPHFLRFTVQFRLYDENMYPITMDDTIDNYIKINYNTDPNLWINYYTEYTESSGRNVFIYKPVVNPNNISSTFIESISFDESLMTAIKAKTTNNNDIAMDFKHNKIFPQIMLQVDAVQNTHAESAIKSVWGIDVVASDSEITEVLS